MQLGIGASRSEIQTLRHVRQHFANSPPHRATAALPSWQKPGTVHFRFTQSFYRLDTQFLGQSVATCANARIDQNCTHDARSLDFAATQLYTEQIYSCTLWGGLWTLDNNNNNNNNHSYFTWDTPTDSLVLLQEAQGRCTEPKKINRVVINGIRSVRHTVRIHGRACMHVHEQLSELYTHAPCMPQTLLFFQLFVENWIWRKWRVTSLFPLRSPCLHHGSSRTKLLRTQYRCSLTIQFVWVMRDVFWLS